MRTEFKNVRVGDIMLDPFNPRFSMPYIDIQSSILGRLLNNKQTKELIKSLNKNIWWSNTIVIRDINTLPAAVRLIIPEVYKYKYIVVEGNSRLASLKSGKVRPRGIEYNDNSTIPVSEAIKEDGESQEQYEMQIKNIQAINNVMMAKEWSIVSKAKHLYEVFLTKKKLYPKMTSSQIIAAISEEIAMDNSIVKDYITKYAFFNEVKKLCGELKEEDWGYLEAFTTSDLVKSLFGMCKDSIEFDWSNNKIFSDFEKQNLLVLIPEIIQTAKLYTSDSKKFRNLFKNLVNQHKDNINEIKDIMISVIDNKQATNWQMIEDSTTPMFNEERCKKELTSIFLKLSRFDANEDFAINLKGLLLNIKNKLDEHLYIINKKERRV